MPERIDGRAFAPTRLPPDPTPVLFVADWCGHCRRFLRLFEDIPQGLVVDISDEDDPLWDDLAIRVVPTVLLFEGGRPTRRWAGVLGAPHAAQIAALEKA